MSSRNVKKGFMRKRYRKIEEKKAKNFIKIKMMQSIK